LEVEKVRIPERWNTNRLVIRKAVLDDKEELNRICVSWEDKVLLEGDGFTTGYIEDCINNGDLPPLKNADISNYYMMTIQKADGQIIGFFDLYHGYPDSETAWISIYVIDKDVQGNAYGQEAIKAICEECKTSGWKSIGIAVHLKNWKGLRFWKNNGFDKIIGIFGDKEYSENTFSVIGISKELK
jgi:GNAT superfamily N-acetyltransferase